MGLSLGWLSREEAACGTDVSGDCLQALGQTDADNRSESMVPAVDEACS